MRNKFSRGWIPDGVHEVTFRWNDVAIETLLRVLEDHYPAGYGSMVDHVRRAVDNPKETR